MNEINYESHVHTDPSFPIIFHLDTAVKGHRNFTHWHEGLEILYVVEGELCVSSDVNTIIAKKDEIVVVNANNIHNMGAVSEKAKYYCLIVEKKMCDEFGIYIEETEFEELITNEIVREKLENIIEEMKSQKVLYKFAVKSAVIDLLVFLQRNFALSVTNISNKHDNLKIELIKKAILYVKKNYRKNILISDIADCVGISKFYLCRLFKEITGYTLVHYINLLRCSNACRLIQAEKYTVSEAAFSCGFENLSYFSKTFKKHMGYLPSELNLIQTDD